jgi:hypothetical protein
MTKILLTNKNSEWGIIVNPVANNTYRHILDFDSEDTKDRFINTQLFPNIPNFDYKVEIEKTKPISRIVIDSVKAIFRVDIDDYPNETIHSLLNKDFAIVKDSGVFYYYSLSGKTKNTKIVEYEAELDIFFQYDIKTIFNNTKAEVESAHYDRYRKEADGKIVADINISSLNSSTENNAMNEGQIPVKATDIQWDFASIIDIQTKDIEDFKIFIKDLNFNVFYSSFTTDSTGQRKYLFGASPLVMIPKDSKFQAVNKLQRYVVSYAVLMTPSIAFKLIDSATPDFATLSQITSITSDEDRTFLENPLLIKNTGTITSSMDLFNYLKFLKEEGVIKIRFNVERPAIEIYRATTQGDSLSAYFPKISTDYSIFNLGGIVYRTNYDNGLLSLPIKLNDLPAIDRNINSDFN